MAAGPVADKGIDFGASGFSLFDGAIDAITGDIHPVHDGGEAAEYLVIGAGDGDPFAVFGGIMAVRYGVDGAGALRSRTKPL